MKVLATRKGFIYGEKRNPGDIFTLVDVKMTKGGIYKAKDQFSENWMEVVTKVKSEDKA
jgi:hypothetical protein